MKSCKFVFNDKIYELSEDKCSDLINDELHPVTGIEISDVLELLSQQEEIDFDITYYGRPCSNCLAGKEEKEEYFTFLKYHFYIFTKNGEYVISNLSEEYKDTSANKLFSKGKIDSSYVVSVIVCIHCGDYSIEIEQCDI